jgi:hypothetical protein
VKRAACALALLIFTFTTPACADGDSLDGLGTNAGRLVSAFDVFCLGHLGDTTAQRSALDGSGWNIIDAKPDPDFLGPVYRSPNAPGTVVISPTDNGACYAVSVSPMDLPTLAEAVETDFTNSEIAFADVPLDPSEGTPESPTRRYVLAIAGACWYLTVMTFKDSRPGGLLALSPPRPVDAASQSPEAKP